MLFRSNRSWQTPYRGCLAIHAGTRYDQHAWDAAKRRSEELEFTLPHRDDVPFGGIVGTVDLTGMLWMEGSEILSTFEKDIDVSHWFNDDGFNIGWVLEKPKPAPFIPMRGKLGIWQMDQATENLLFP